MKSWIKRRFTKAKPTGDYHINDVQMSNLYLIFMAGGFSIGAGMTGVHFLIEELGKDGLCQSPEAWLYGSSAVVGLVILCLMINHVRKRFFTPYDKATEDRGGQER